MSADTDAVRTTIGYAYFDASTGEYLVHGLAVELTVGFGTLSWAETEARCRRTFGVGRLVRSPAKNNRVEWVQSPIARAIGDVLAADPT